VYNKIDLKNNLKKIPQKQLKEKIMAELTDFSTTEVTVFPPLYGKIMSTGKTKVWNARVLTNSSGHGISEIRYGQKNGALQVAEKVIDTGKNIGKKNETSPVNQCISEVRRKWLDKKEKEGYVENEEEMTVIKNEKILILIKINSYNFVFTLQSIFIHLHCIHSFNFNSHCH